MRIKFCGAAREVTGSSHLITLDDGFKILLDCGLYQGYDDEMEKTNREWLFDPEDLDCVILSHAHIDHTGKLPRLFRDGYRGEVHCTHATRSLCSIMLLDSAYIQERDAAYENKKRRKKNKNAPLLEPLYLERDVKIAMDNFVSYGYNSWHSIHERVEILFKDAGHILGSASVTLRIKENGKEVLIGFTGDIGRPDRPILRDPQAMPEVDYLLCESTYGDREHMAKPDESERLKQIIEEACVEKRGKLIIPAFSVGRTQEIVYMLDQMETAGELPHIPVFVDSPLAVNATAIFGSHPECYDNELSAYLLVDENPFGFNSLTYVRHVDISKQLNTFEGPGIIISASGMMTAGRIRHHLYNSISSSRNTILIVGYCAPHTTGAIIKGGAEFVRIFGDMVPIRAKIEIMDSFSAHGDKHEMLEFIQNQHRLSRLFLVHGEYDTQQHFKAYLEKSGFQNIEIPSRGQEFVLE